MGFEQGPTAEQPRDWPYIEMSPDPRVRAVLQGKLSSYDARIHTDTNLYMIGSILQEDYRNRARTGLVKTDAYLKMIYATAVLHNGFCDTDQMHRDFHTRPDWRSEFLAIQLADPHKFDELSWNAAEVIKEYATGTVTPGLAEPGV